MRSDAELKRQADSLKATTVQQVKEIKHLQSQLASARLAAKQDATQIAHLIQKCATLETDAASLKNELKMKEKELKKKETDLKSALKMVDYQTELKLKASVEKERLRVKKEEVAL